MKMKYIILSSILIILLNSTIASANYSDCEICNSTNEEGFIPGEIYDIPPSGKGDTFIGNAPPSWDWRNVDGKDYTTKIKNQGECGSCYAFGNLAALESNVKIKLDAPGMNIDFSEQFMVSCGWGWTSGMDGCNGAEIDPTYDFIKDYGAIAESSFPYSSGGGTTGSCDRKYPNYEDFKFDIQSWGSVNSNVEDIKNALVQYGPLPTSMVVYDDFFGGYTGGVYHHPGDESDVKTNHRVTIVGYDDSQSCWICKNSWGKDWGENGWFKIAYGDCRIEDFTRYFVLDDFDDVYDFELEITIHRVKMLEEIEGLFHGDADWSYRVSVYNDVVLVDQYNDYTTDIDDHTQDVNHNFKLSSVTTTPTIVLKLWDRDPYVPLVDDNDLADISRHSGSGIDDSIVDKRGCMCYFKYDIVNDEIIDIDEIDENEGYYTTEGGGNNNAKVWFKITDKYKAPEADAGGPYSGMVDETIQLSGSATNGKPPINYYWDLDNDGSFDDATSQNTEKSWSSAGDYTIKLKVEDNFGITDIDEAIVTVTKNSPPNKPDIPSGPTSGNTDETYQYSFKATDPDEDDVCFYIDWGDDTNSDWTQTVSSGETFRKSHSFSEKGSYEIKVKAKDVKGEVSSWSQPLTVTMPKNRYIKLQNLLENLWINNYLLMRLTSIFSNKHFNKNI